MICWRLVGRSASQLDCERQTIENGDRCELSVTGTRLHRRGQLGDAADGRLDLHALATPLERAFDRLDHTHDLESELSGRPWLAEAPNRAAEVEHLREQRLGRGEVRRDDVAGPVAELELAEGLRARKSTPESKIRTGSLLVSS